jgi:FMN phosphatase YigB (HAD superfamily)
MTKDAGRGAAPPKAVMFDLDDTLVISTIEFKKFRTRLLSYMRDKVTDLSCYSTREATVTMIARFEEEMKAKGVDERTIISYLDDIDAFLNEIELALLQKSQHQNSLLVAS